MNALQAIYTRKSPEKFNEAPIEGTELQTIVEAGNYAPIFGKIHFTVITNSEVLDTINHVSLEMMRHSGNAFAEKMANTPDYNAVRHASAFVIISAPGGNDTMGFNMANVSCAAENMQLAATELGIGSRFMMGPIMSLSQETIKSKIALPEGYQPLVAVALGHIDEDLTERRKNLDNIRYL